MPGHNPVTVLEQNPLDSMTVHKCSVGTSEIPDLAERGGHLDHAMITRKRSIFGNRAMYVTRTADHKGIVAVEDERFAFAGS